MHTSIKSIPVLIVSLFVILVAGQGLAQTIFVDGAATGLADGSSWENAFPVLQDALDAAPAQGGEIWVAAGTYVPTVMAGGDTDRHRAFVLKNGVAVLGGFAGTETAAGQRDWLANPVILSGDIGVGGDSSDNCFHVFYHGPGSNLDATAILDGVTIAHGNGDLVGGDNRRGGGMYNEDASPTITHCVFTDNQSVGGSYCWGGGLYNEDSSPLVTGCSFVANTAGRGGGAVVNMGSSLPVFRQCVFQDNQAGLVDSGNGDGGAFYNSDYAQPRLVDCTFENNRSNYNGGALYNTGSHGQVSAVGCRFLNNSTGMYGGAVYNTGTDPTLTQCVFHGNTATAGNAHGGVIYSTSSSPVLTNCVLYDNESGCVGNGIYSVQFSDPVITNCILSGSDVVYDGSYSAAVVTYCNIQQAGYEDAGLHNNAGDPLFVDPEAGDFHLQAGSPCIDAGNSQAVPLDSCDLDLDGDCAEVLPRDLFGNARCADDPATADTGQGPGAVVDMGVHELGNVSAVPQAQALRLTAYPNPFNPALELRFSVESAGQVRLEVFDLRGGLVRVLVQERLEAGDHTFAWDATDQRGGRVGAGVYLARLWTGAGQATRKLALVK